MCLKASSEPRLANLLFQVFFKQTSYHIFELQVEKAFSKWILNTKFPMLRLGAFQDNCCVLYIEIVDF